MSENIQISIPAGRKYLLETAGKICDKNIVINAGTASAEGTAIPVGRAMNELYLGTHLDKECVDSILSQLTFYNTELFEYPIHCCYFAVNPTNTNEFLAIVVMHEGEESEPYTIYAFSGDISIPESVSATTLYSMHGGWNVWLHTSGGYWDFTGCLNLVSCGSTLFSVPLTEFAGIPIGLENEKIKNILSITPFVSDRYEEGKKAEYDAFWDVYQQNGARTSYDGAFGGEGWTPEFFKPKYNINPTSAAYMFRKSNISGDLVEICNDLGISMDFSNCTSFMETFSNAPNITRVGVIDIRKAGLNITNMFAYSGVKTIDKVLIAETNTLTYFPGVMLSLENISFEGVIANSISFAYSSALSMASVDSIISCLKDLTGQTAQTLTFHASVGAKLTAEQKASITAKNWQLVY